MEKIGIIGIFWGKETLSVTEMTGKKSRFRAFATRAKNSVSPLSRKYALEVLDLPKRYCVSVGQRAAVKL